MAPRLNLVRIATGIKFIEFVQPVGRYVGMLSHIIVLLFTLSILMITTQLVPVTN